MRKDTTKIRRKLRPMGALEKALYKKFIRVEKQYGSWVVTFAVGVQSRPPSPVLTRPWPVCSCETPTLA